MQKFIKCTLSYLLLLSLIGIINDNGKNTYVVDEENEVINNNDRRFLDKQNGGN